MAKPKQKVPKFSIVVPVYNSEDSLRLLHERLEKVFTSLNATWELILANDCSNDKSWDVMQELAQKDRRVIAINLLNNFGQHNAIMCGLHHATSHYIVTMDDDLQHPPEEIVKLAQTIEAGDYSIVYGQYEQKRHGGFRDFCSMAVNKILSRITGSGYNVTSFRIMRHEVAAQIIRSTQYYVMIDVLIKDTVHNSRVGHCVVEHHSRTIGKSNYSFKKLFWFALNMIFNFTTWPLRLASILGLIFSLLSFTAGFFYIIYYLIEGIKVSGWTSLMLAITFLSGLILFVLGIMGEYLGRIFLNVGNKPQFVVKDIVSRNNKRQKS